MSTQVKINQWDVNILPFDTSLKKVDSILSHLERWRENVHSIVDDNIVYLYLKKFFTSELPRWDSIENLTNIIEKQMNLLSNYSDKLIFIENLQESLLRLIDNSLKSPLNIGSVNDLISCLSYDIYNKFKIHFWTDSFLNRVSLGFEKSIVAYMECEDNFIVDKYTHSISAYMWILNKNRRIRYSLPSENIEEYLQLEFINLCYTFLDQSNYTNISRLFNSTPWFKPSIQIEDLKVFLSELYDRFLSYECKISSKHIYAAITTANKNFNHKDKKYFKKLMINLNLAYSNMPRDLTHIKSSAIILDFWKT